MAGVIHVGAWTGDEYVSARGPLLLIEPQAGPFRVMKVRFHDRSDVEMHQVACGADRGTATLHIAHPDHSSSLLKPKVKTHGEIKFPGRRTVVDVCTLDSIVRGRNGYDTLRIDVQGFEMEVLRGATDTLFRLSRVEVEVHDPNVYSGAASIDEIDSLLTVAGFDRTSWDGTNAVYTRTDPIAA